MNEDDSLSINSQQIKVYLPKFFFLGCFIVY